MARLEQFNVQWEYEFDNTGIETLKLLAHTTVCHSPLCTLDALYGGMIEAMQVHYKEREGKNSLYVDGMILYPYICKYFKFLEAIQASMWETSAKKMKPACVRMVL